MRKLALLPGFLVLLAVSPRGADALILSHVLTSSTVSSDVLFDSTLGSLTSVGLEIRFQASVVFENQYYDSTPGTVNPFDVTFSGEAPFVIFDDVGYRDRTFSWSLSGHGDGGSNSPYYWAQASGTSFRTYTGQDILDFFTFHEGDQGLSFYGWNDWISCSPEAIWDSRFNKYDAFYANSQLGDGVVLTYNYDALVPVPEPGSVVFLGVGAALLLSLRIRPGKRRDASTPDP